MMSSHSSRPIELSAAVREVPLSQQLGAKVQHFYLKPFSKGTMLVVDAVSSHLEEPSELVKRLMWFGAVYSCKVVPIPAASIEESLRNQILAWRSEGIEKHGRDTRLCHPIRVLDPCHSFNTEDGAYFRRGNAMRPG